MEILKKIKSMVCGEIGDIIDYNLEKERFASLEELINIGYYELSTKGSPVFFSDNMFFMLGALPTDEVEDIVQDNIYHIDFQKYKKFLKRLVDSNKKSKVSIRFVSKRSKEIIETNLHGLIFGKNKERKILIVMRDVTSIVKEKKEMIDARKKAEDISLAKSFFLAQASHDLRQPAQAIRMMLYHLDLKNMSEKQEDTISELKLIGGNLSHLLDNLMDISKIDYAEDHYSPYSFSLAKFLKPLLKEFSAIATTSKISFKKKVVDVKIFSDEFYLERLLRNLLSNAVKFTKNSVEFLTSVDEDRLNISIIDNGCGISKADMKYIFDDFFQSTNAKRKKLGGVGLGLPIVKKTADLLDINIEVTSKHNKGTRFDLIIKIK